MAVAPAPAFAVGWEAPVTVTGSSGAPASSALLSGGGALTAISGSASSSLVNGSGDDGATWATAAGPAGSPVAAAVASNGERVFAYISGTFKIRVNRVSPSGTFSGPLVEGTEITGVMPHPNELDVAVNPAGDVLLVWTSQMGTANTQVAFWPADAATFSTAQDLGPSSSSGTGPNAILDPAGSATVVWAQTVSGSTPEVRQSSSANAASPASFSPPAAMNAAGSFLGFNPVARQKPDGSAILVFGEEVNVASPDPGYGSTQRRAVSAGRAAGGSFGPTTILGDDPHKFVNGGRILDVSPTGAAIAAFQVSENTTGGSQTCQDILGSGAIRVFVGTAGSALATAPAATYQPSDRNVSAPTVAAGPDGRLAVGWREGNCVMGSPGSAHAVFAPPTGGLTDIADPPAFVSSLGFRADGDLYALTSENPSGSGVLSGRVYDTGVPVAGGPTGGGGTPPPSGGGLPTTPDGTAPSTTKPPVVTTVELGTIQSVKTIQNPDGSLTVQFLSPPGFITITAILRNNALLSSKSKSKSKSRLVVVATAKRRVTKRGTVSLKLKLTGRGLRTLNKRRRLTATLRTTFTPLGGRAKTTTRTATFRKRAARRP